MGEKQLPSTVFADGGLARFYEPIARYQGRHRWDPKAERSSAEEKS